MTERSFTAGKVHRDAEKRHACGHCDHGIADHPEGTNTVLKRERTDLRAEAPENNGTDENDQYRDLAAGRFSDVL